MPCVQIFTHALISLMPICYRRHEYRFHYALCKCYLRTAGENTMLVFWYQHICFGSPVPNIPVLGQYVLVVPLEHFLSMQSLEQAVVWAYFCQSAFTWWDPLGIFSRCTTYKAHASLRVYLSSHDFWQSALCPRPLGPQNQYDWLWAPPTMKYPFWDLLNYTSPKLTSRSNQGIHSEY